MKNTVLDVLVVGGGINGCGIAADAAGRGLNVMLCEQDDLAAHTSSKSSKLIHGGLRYLEFYEFKLVREALTERDILIQNAPHLIKPLRIIMPHDKTQRPQWMIRIGLFLYDHLHSSKHFPKSCKVKLKKSGPLKADYSVGFEYSDATVDDVALTRACAAQAKQHGADIRTQTQVVNAVRQDKIWHISLKTKHKTYTIKAKAIVNAAGPWVDKVIAQLGLTSQHHIRMVKGSHLITRKLYDGDKAYILQHTDGRIVFVIPHQGNHTLIGTTDVPFEGDPSDVQISPAETQYLLDAANRYFKQPVTEQDIESTFAGVRPLQSDEHESASKVTRDYTFEVDDENGTAPILSVFGGKITTYRKLAEHALEQLKPYCPGMKSAWTAGAMLPKP
jgi:glycerol-3-phosphate dehydrogenase